MLCFVCACNDGNNFYFKYNGENISIDEGETFNLQDAEFETNVDLNDIAIVCSSSILEIHDKTIFAKSKGNAVIKVVFAPTNKVLCRIRVYVTKTIEIDLNNSTNNQTPEQNQGESNAFDEDSQQTSGLTYTMSVQDVDGQFDRYTFEIYKNNSSFDNYSATYSSLAEYKELTKVGYTLFFVVTKNASFEITVTDLDDNVVLLLKNN